MSSPAVKYRSLAGDVMDAVLLVVEGDRATVDVRVPGSSIPFRATRIPFLAVDNGEGMVCFTGAAVAGSKDRRRQVLAAEAAVDEPVVLGRRARRAARVAAKAKPGG